MVSPKKTEQDFKQWWLWLLIGLIMPSLSLIFVLLENLQHRSAMANALNRIIKPSEAVQKSWNLVDVAHTHHTLSGTQWQELSKDYGSSDAGLRASALTALGWLSKDPARANAVSMAQSSLGDPEPSNQFLAMLALKRLGDPSWRAACEPMMKSTIPLIAEHANKVYRSKK